MVMVMVMEVKSAVRCNCFSETEEEDYSVSEKEREWWPVAIETEKRVISNLSLCICKAPKHSESRCTERIIFGRTANTMN